MPYYPINSKNKPVNHDPQPDPTYIKRQQEEYLRDFFGDAGYEALERAKRKERDDAQKS